MNFTERAVPTLSANFLMKEAESRYVFAQKYIKKSQLVLDMACGTGYGSQVLSNSNIQYIGIDISDEALDFAQKMYASPSVSFIKMDVMSSIFDSDSFDRIIAFEMIEHLKKPREFVKEANRILKKQGYFIVSTPNRLIQSPDGKLMSPYHTKEYSPAEFKKLLSSSFKSVEIIGQRKNAAVVKQVESFMRSQGARQFLVNIDVLGIRYLFTKTFKEHLWKYVGVLFGRNAQESTKVSDFVFSKKNLDSAEYLIAVCKK